MQAVHMDIGKHSKDARCKLLYDQLLDQQSSWMRKYAPAVEHACASTVVDANRPDMNSDPLNLRYSSKIQPNRRTRILNIHADIDSEAQLSKLSQLSVQSRWLD